MSAAVETYTDRGFSVIPCAPRSKRAAEEWREFQARRPTESEVQAMFSDADRNVAVVTGIISGLVVVDVDGVDGEAALSELEVPRTVTVVTGKGRHLWFQHPGGVVRNRTRFLPGIDLRGDGGYVLAPPSVHPSGHCYTFAEGLGLGEVEIAALPAWAIEVPRPVERRPEDDVPRSGSSTNYGLAALESEVAGVVSATVGTRNATLNTAAFSLGQLVGGGILERAVAEAKLERAGLGVGLGQVETRATVRSGLEAGMLEPRSRPEDGRMTAEEQAAFKRLTTAFPGSEVGEFEPYPEREEARDDGGPSPLRGEDAFELVPLDWSRVEAEGIPEVEYISHPYIPAGARVWAWGPAESGKSLWALHQVCRLSREDVKVAYFSQENPYAEDVRRLELLRPDWSGLLFFHDQGVDLANREHVAEIIRVTAGCRLIVFDTLSACWSGPEDDNAAIATLDRESLQRIVRSSGASVFVVDHTGHPVAFTPRKGVSAGRGASAKGQKADVGLVFSVAGPNEFTIDHAKNRMGGHKELPRRFKVVDTDDGIELESVEVSIDAKVEAAADHIVEAVRASGYLTTRAVREALKGRFGSDTISNAMVLLKGEKEPRVRVADETITGDRGGRQRAKVWRSAEGVLGVF